MIDIKDMKKSEVLAKLYNASKPQGLGFLHYIPKPMTNKEAQVYIDSGMDYFDYLNGRVMKVNISGDKLDPRLYDRDNGTGAAARALGVTSTSNNEEKKCQ
jgi:hypothetical protein